jgi:hypothetical protein
VTSGSSRLERMLERLLPHEEIGWKELNEVFTRFMVVKTPWFRVFIHRLNAPKWHPQAHDHPWSFLSVILSTGYWERSPRGTILNQTVQDEQRLLEEFEPLRIRGEWFRPEPTLLHRIRALLAGAGPGIRSHLTV